MTRELTRWIVLILVVACVVSLVLWARGPAHHHGQNVSVVIVHTDGSAQ